MSNAHSFLRVLPALVALSTAAIAQHPILTVQIRPTSVAGCGDVNLDGVPDFIAGNADGPGPGFARVYSGATAQVLFTIDGDSGGDQAGFAVCSAGDVDLDGHPDFAVGANGADTGSPNAGLVRVYSGATGAQLRQYVGANTFAKFGTSLALVGDIDGDGRADLVVGAPYEDHGGIRGSARVYSGADGSLLLSLFGSQVEDVFGISVAAAGDIDADGRADFIVGANQSTSSTKAGYARVFSGASGAILLTFSGDAPGDRFGSRVAGEGDLDRDGVSDFVVSAPQAGLQSHFGMVRALSGANGSTLHTLLSLGAFGSSLAMIGDLNFDGAADYVAGEELTLGGRAVVVSGLTGHALYRITSTGPSEFLGRCVGRLDDLTGDGLPEVMVGVPNGNIGGGPIGFLRIYSGMNGTPSTYCVAKLNSLGCTPAIGFHGLPNCDSDDNFRIQASQILNNSLGFLVLGSAPASLTAFGGTICVGGSIVRSASQNSGGSASGDDCTGSFDLALPHAFLNSHGWNPGTTVYAQWWSRDRGFLAPDNVSLTEGLAFQVCP